MRSPSARPLLTVVVASFALALGGCANEQGGGAGADGNEGSSEAGSGGENGGQDNGGEGAQDDSDNRQRYPDIKSVEIEKVDESTADLSVTVSSPYDSPERYADGWRVLDQDDQVLGEHTLAHDHADEQPFTRTQTGLTVPDGTQELTVQGRDLKNGYGGQTATVLWEE
jgi:hypothetical protein